MFPGGSRECALGCRAGIRRRGRLTTNRPRYDIFIFMSKLLSVSAPDELIAEAEAYARSRGKTKSEIVRDALRRYLQIEKFRELQGYGRRQAEVRGIGPDDAVDLVDELRRSSQ